MSCAGITHTACFRQTVSSRKWSHSVAATTVNLDDVCVCVCMYVCVCVRCVVYQYVCVVCLSVCVCFFFINEACSITHGNTTCYWYTIRLMLVHN